MRSYAEWFNVARIAVDYQASRGHWQEEGLARKAALAATGLPDGAGIDALVETIEAGTRIAPNDDPHDAFDPRLVAKQTIATKSVPAPDDAPNPGSFPKPSILGSLDFQMPPDGCCDWNAKRS